MSTTTILTAPRTSGQHEPLFADLAPYTSFPHQIHGSTAWSADTLRANPELWTHIWQPAEIQAIDSAATAFLAAGWELTEITKERFPLPPALTSLLETTRQELLHGRGLILFKGLPVTQWDRRKCAAAYMGLGSYLGHFVSQNGRGHVLGHVKDLGEDSTQIDKVRIYRTNARQYFHADDSDLVGLLCLARALEGGESDVVSAHTVFNVLQRERPDVVETLCQPTWYFDRKGEVSPGQAEWIRASVFYWWGGRLYSKWDPYYVRSLTRFSSTGLIPPLTPAQLTALDVLENTCRRLSLHMVLDVGDLQVVSNTHVFHARTEYTDHAPPAPRRHLLRLWLATPESEGGWALPFHDSGEAKRGGIRVEGVEENAPLEAE
ncbi:uncharacterized protein H6S33_006192 [Morchella sextelata]|uniref:uncharacterized protein n=1 Tax=Morchella sextelata TaxID=1174677 RepID=UPI001D04BAED|nr:uncharacterized protein H6S33_006192 [Morchella sextelata]KAH0614306.1 hypothetical protein H6S33_006192 [Morchella sextelata]